MGEQLLLWLCSFVQRCAGGAQGGAGRRAGLRCCPGPTLLDLGLSPCKAAITTSKGQPRDALKVFGHRSICSGQRQALDKVLSNEQRGQDSKVWGVKGEARVVTQVNLSSYSFEIVQQEHYPCSAVCLNAPGQSILPCRAQSMAGVTLLSCCPMDTATLGQG